MLRRIPWIASVVVLLVAVLSACGGKNSDSVVKDLSKVADNLESYQGSGEMILHTGQTPLTYKVEVWYQQPNYYRIALTSSERDITQIVLKNDQGVYVLTPQLKKSYRFQSDWPENQGQVYLYQTLLHSITLDNSRQFTTEKDAYVFNVSASNYTNGSFARQKIWLDKDNYAPQKVEVTDTNANLMVEVNFTDFQFGKKFDKSAFDMQQNMAGVPGANAPDNASPAPGASSSPAPSASGSPSPSPTDKGTAGTTDPTSGDADDGTADDVTSSPEATDPTSGSLDGATDGTSGSGDAAASGTDAAGDAGAAASAELVQIEPDPDALPEGVEQLDSQEVMLGDTPAVMIRYTGTYDFTITESVPADNAVSGPEGHLVDLGFTAGLLSGDDTQSLTWTYDGVEYRLTTIDLPLPDMVRVAQSMVESPGK